LLWTAELNFDQLLFRLTIASALATFSGRIGPCLEPENQPRRAYSLVEAVQAGWHRQTTSGPRQGLSSAGHGLEVTSGRSEAQIKQRRGAAVLISALRSTHRSSQVAKPTSKNRKGPAGWPPRIPNADLDSRPGGRIEKIKDGPPKSPVGRLAISIINERRLVVGLPPDSFRRTPSLPKIDLGEKG
jgi:hypothetical protein